MYRNMTDHMLTPLRAVDSAGHLVVNMSVNAAEEAASEFQRIPGGRLMHLTDATNQNELPVAKLGCSGNQKIPVWLYRDSDSYSAGFEGPDVAVVVHPTWNTGMEKRLLGYIGLEGFELATTEFDKNRTYLVGQYLRAPQAGESGAANLSVDVNTIAGIVTNATVRNGVETIIGIVSPGVAAPMQKDNRIDEYGNHVLTLYTTYRPPVQGVRQGVAVNVANGNGAA